MGRLFGWRTGLLRGSPETGDGEGRRECLPDGQGGKLLSGKGKAVLFTALSTGNGDKVVSVAGCACVGAGGGRQVLPDGFFHAVFAWWRRFRAGCCLCGFQVVSGGAVCGDDGADGALFSGQGGCPEGGGYSATGVVSVVSVPVCVVSSRSLRVSCASASPAMAAFWSQYPALAMFFSTPMPR